MQSNAHVYFQLVLVCSHCLRQLIGRGWNYSGHDCSAVWSCLDGFFWHFMRLCNPLHSRQVWRQAIACVVYRHYIYISRYEFETYILHFESLMILNTSFSAGSIVEAVENGNCRSIGLQRLSWRRSNWMRPWIHFAKTCKSVKDHRTSFKEPLQLLLFVFNQGLQVQRLR